MVTVRITTDSERWATAVHWFRSITPEQDLHFCRFLRIVTSYYKQLMDGHSRELTTRLARATYSLYGTVCMLGLKDEANAVLREWDGWRWQQRFNVEHGRQGVAR